MLRRRKNSRFGSRTLSDSRIREEKEKKNEESKKIINKYGDRDAGVRLSEMSLSSLA